MRELSVVLGPELGYEVYLKAKNRIQDFLKWCSLRGAGFDEGGGVGLNLSHGLSIVNFLSACWTFVKLQS